MKKLLLALSLVSVVSMKASEGAPVVSETTQGWLTRNVFTPVSSISSDAYAGAKNQSSKFADFVRPTVTNSKVQIGAVALVVAFVAYKYVTTHNKAKKNKTAPAF